MTTTKERLVPYRIVWWCDECGGEMWPSGNPDWFAEPLLFPHKCVSCGREESADEKYPCLKHELEGEGDG